jgi:hypothetical protein
MPEGDYGELRESLCSVRCRQRDAKLERHWSSRNVSRAQTGPGSQICMRMLRAWGRHKFQDTSAICAVPTLDVDSAAWPS